MGVSLFGSLSGRRVGGMHSNWNVFPLNYILTAAGCSL